ncbi:MAG: hypothetical protein FJ033_11235 [Chloroflexi bacterium]|nr:hypothetical protein [Chloroflexota bacterium]
MVPATRLYERRLGRVIQECLAARKELLLEMGGLDRAPALATVRARRLGERFLTRFAALRREIEVTPVPSGGTRCQGALRRWIDLHVRACDALARLGFGSDLRPIGAAARYIGDARLAAREFNRAHRVFAAPLAA